jgi:kynureninase
MIDPLLRYRPEFPILEKTTYLISNSLGAMPRGRSRWTVGNQIGGLMNAPENSVAIHGNVTQCQAVIASCFEFDGRRNKVVYSDLNFPPSCISGRRSSCAERGFTW